MMKTTGEAGNSVETSFDETLRKRYALPRAHLETKKA